jgi:drug/metabolite transporter (DMT)-like permease
VNLRKYLVLAGVSVFAPVGDSLLSYGMKQVGNISLRNLPDLLLAITNPWVGMGIVMLLGFFASYMTALSWADLTYVLPASSLGYVLLALIARFALHERISLTRWVGIALVSSGVGFVTSGPEVTKRPRRPRVAEDNRAVKHP